MRINIKIIVGVLALALGCIIIAVVGFVGVCVYRAAEKMSVSEINWDARIESPNLSEGEFTELSAKVVKTILPDAIVKITAPKAIRVDIKETPGQKPLSLAMNLENAWQMCRNSAGHRKEILKPFFANLTQISSMSSHGRKIAADLIIPVIRTEQTLGTLAGGQKIDFTKAPLGADLLIVYVLESPNSISYLLPKERATLKLTDEELKVKAVQNLTKLLSTREVRWGSNGELKMVICGGDYESSLPLVDSVMTATKDKNAGHIVFSIPARDMFYVSDDSKPANIEGLRKKTQETYANGTHKISDRLYKYVDGKITFFD